MLTVSRVFPSVGSRLLRHCLAQWPIRFNFDAKPCLAQSPKVSVLVAIGGSDRIPQFRLALASLRGQSCSAIEIIVVEQGAVATLQSELPPDVVYHHDHSIDHAPFNKSKALNIGASLARGESLIIHDADFLVPRDYVSEVARTLEYAEASRPARFIFYVSRASTFLATESGCLTSQCDIDEIRQNTPMPIAIRRGHFFAVGAFDESFAGWGGEDEEFLSRVRAICLSEGGRVPIVHLWHPSSTGKTTRSNQGLFDEIMRTPRDERIERLKTSGATLAK